MPERPTGDCEQCGFAGGWLRVFGPLCAIYALVWLRRAPGILAFRAGAVALFAVGALSLVAFEPWAMEAALRLHDYAGQGLGATRAETPALVSPRVVVGWGATLTVWTLLIGLSASAIGFVADARGLFSGRSSD